VGGSGLPAVARPRPRAVRAVDDRYAALPVTTPEDLRALGPRAYRAWSPSIAAARSLEPPAPGWNA